MLGLGTRTKKKKLVKKALTMFVPQIRSQHPTHDHLRRSLNRVNRRVVVRLGSTTSLQDIYRKKNLTPFQMEKIVEINTVQAIENSADKKLMKQCFEEGDVKTAMWYTYGNGHFWSSHGHDNNESFNISELEYPIIAKHRFGSRGTGNHKLDTQAQLESWMRGKDLTNYIFEKFYNFSREYRLHVTADGCFYTCRKLLREDTPDNQRWFRNDSNCVWIVEDNASFDKPSNWDVIVSECVKALNAVGLDIGGFDVKVQSRTDSRGRVRQNPDFIVIESNSACSHGDITAVKYREQLNNLIRKKVYGGSGS